MIMEIALAFACIIIAAIAFFFIQKIQKEKADISTDYQSLLAAIQSPICIADAQGRLISVINKPYVKESAFDLNVPSGYNLCEMIDNQDDRKRFLTNLREVINDKTANYVNQDFIIKDDQGTLYRALLHIIYYKPGQAYVFINRIRLPKQS